MSLLESRLWRRQRFMGSTTDWEKATIVIMGVPMDFTTSFRPGARFGPGRIREVSEGLEEYSFYLDRSLEDVAFYDAGDLATGWGNVQATLTATREVVAEILAQKRVPLVLGGEHLITLSVVQAMAQVYHDLVVLHFDAHADLRQEYLGEQLSHATVMRRVVDIIGPQNLYQLGIRSGTSEEFIYGHRYTNFYPDAVLEPLRESLPELKGRPVYVSIDIDVVDPAFAPGTGTPEPGGCSSREIIEAVHLLSALNVVGLDIVEVCPPVDQADITALLAAKLVREALLVCH